MTEQALQMSKRPHILVATPGRLRDHINSNSDAIHFKHVKYLVLDEADRLLHPSFIPDVEEILTMLPKKKQTLLFTATLTPEMKGLTFQGRTPFVFQEQEQYATVDLLSQKYLLLPSQVRDAYLSFLLQETFPHSNENSAIIFVNKCVSAERLKIMLQKLGVRCTALHAKMGQGDRIGSLAKFKSMVVPVLITTDVGSR
jgi:ATP-dependent RNA helicase DDX49/DBP8